MANKDKQRSYPSQSVRDGGGNIVDFQISNGESVAINPSTAGYTPPALIAEKGFYICPLTTGILVVRLVGQSTGSSFTIPAARVDVMTGFWMEEKVAEIIQSGTTVTSCLIGWSY